MTYGKLGEKPKMETVSRGPLDVKREREEIRYLYALGGYILVWICIAIYAYHSGDIAVRRTVNAFNHMEIADLTSFLLENFHLAWHVTLGFLTMFVTLLTAYIILFRWFTDVLVYVTLVLSVVSFIMANVLVFLSIHMIETEIRYYIVFAIILIIFGIFFHAFRKVGVKTVSKIIRQACKAMFFFPSTLAFMLGQYILELIVIVYAGSVYVYLDSIRNFQNDSGDPDFEDFFNSSGNSSEEWMFNEYEFLTEFHKRYRVPAGIYLLHIINGIGFFWLLFFVSGIGRMVLTATFATWYHCKDKKLIPNWIIKDCLVLTLKYHAGTAAYGASPMSLVPMCIIIHRYGRERLKEMLKQPFFILSWLIIVYKFSFDALAICAMHGHKFYKSGKDSYILLMKNPLSIVTINTISECVIFIGSLVLPFFSMIMVSIYWYIHRDKTGPPSVQIASILMVYLVSYLMSSICFGIFRAASNTIHRCFLEDSKFNHESEMNLYEIQIDDETFYNDLDS